MKNYAPEDTHGHQSPSTTSLLLSAKTLSKTLICAAALIAFALAASPALQAQTCEYIPDPGAESLSGQISINGVPLTDGMVVPIGTQLRIDSIATATGSCTGMAWVPNANPPRCEPTGYVYERVPNHIEVSVEILTGTDVLGFLVGYVWGTGGPTQHVINSAASDTTGPINMNAGWKGTYTFHFNANINTTPCNLAPSMMPEQIITINVGESDGGADYGATSCNANVGEPINVTNGNVYLQQTDYRLPGFGAGLELTRTYNSKMQRAGLFGYSWSVDSRRVDPDV